MIKNSFIFLEKISNQGEKKLWQQGITNWQEFLNSDKIKGISSLRKKYYCRKLQEVQQALLEENYSYFRGKLPQMEMWRLYNYCKDECCYLDVEIDEQGRVILIGISDYYNTNFFLHGFNLSKKLIELELSKYKAVITFNGSSFDLPKLKKMGLNINQIHIDLKQLSINLGLTSGLKEIERRLELKRPEHLYGNPVNLWRSFHASGDREYLDLLIEYNREDVENLKQIMEYVYKKMKEKLYKEINSL